MEFMADPGNTSDPRSPLVEDLAEGYLSRLRDGERPRISEYTRAHPDLADEIRDVFSTLAMLEDFAPDVGEEIEEDHPPFPEIPKQLGEYRIVRELGRGGMGVVYEAEHSIMRRRVALKVLFPAAAARGHDLGRFLREARAAGRLHHTNIVPVFEVGADKGMHFYAMQCIRGQNLDVVIGDLKRLRDTSNSGVQIPGSNHAERSAAQALLSGRFDRSSVTLAPASEPESPRGQTAFDQETDTQKIVIPETSELANVGDTREQYFHRIARVALAVADALSYAHQHGILHRDIKPSNLILDTTGTVWVTDFGLAQSEGEDLTKTGDIVGTLRYMAPERFRGTADSRSDVYSLGLTLYELCTLRHAFDQTDRGDLIRNVMRVQPPMPSRVNSSIPRDLETIVLKSIAQEPNARYASAEAFADDLRLFLTDRPIQARRSSLIEQSWRWCRRNPFVASLLSCIATLLAVIFIGAVAFAIRAKTYNRQLLAEQAISRANLYDAYFSRAQAERQNQVTANRGDKRAALSAAASLLPSLRLPAGELANKRLNLRNEVIAMFAQTDIAIHASLSGSGQTRSTRSYSRDYSRYAVSRGSIEIRSTKNEELLQKLPSSGSRGSNLAFSPGGRYLASVHKNQGSSAQARIWDLRAGEYVKEVDVESGRFRFWKNDSLAVWNKARVTVYDLTKPDSIRSHEFDLPARDIQFSPGGDRIAAVGDAPIIEVWSLADDETESVPLPSNAASIDWCGTTQQLVVGTQKGVLLIFDGNDLAADPARVRGHYDSIYQASVAPDGSVVATTSWDATLRLWDLRTEQEIKRLVGMHIVNGFSEDSRFLACAKADGTSVVIEMARDGPWRQYFSRDLPRRNDVAFHPNHPWLAAVATSFHVEFWDLRTRHFSELLRTERTFSLRFSEDGQTLLTSGRRGLREWKLASPVEGTWPENIASDSRFLVEGDTYRMDASEHLKRVAYADVDGQVFVREVAAGGSPKQLADQNDALRPCVSPDGKWVAVTCTKGLALSVWDAESGRHAVTLDAKSGARCVSFSDDGKWLVANGVNRRTLWQVGTWERVHDKQRAEKQAGIAAFSPDSQIVAMTRNHFSVDLVDRETFEILAVLPVADRRNIQNLSFSADGTKLAIALRDRFEVWDLSALRTELADMKLDW